ncbi:type II toxin-antitoxin system RelE/ParE family toxin [Variovorax beijingensis]|uniref:type II toxin-antitoxin system RelE/ParE family toxin n=1 Tax=Variovorax beijingensis TaxID=2496117 RepID=UPI003B84AB78
MRVLWTLSAEQDRADIVDFIAQDNPLAAIRMDETFSAAVGRLAEHPPVRTGRTDPGHP